MTQKFVSEIKKQGYTLIPNLIKASECEKYKKLLENYYKKYSKSYASSSKKNTLADKSFEKVVYNLHNKNILWFKLFKNKKILKILDIILKEGSYNNQEPYYLNNISARCPTKGNKGQVIHLDSNLPGVNYNIITNVIWYFDDVNKKNGTTLLVPGSHRYLKYANKNNIRRLKYIDAKKGSVLVFNSNLWHGGTKKINSNSRWALVLGYARWFIKPSFDFMKNTPREIYKKLTKKDKSLLGFDLVPPKDEFTRITRRSNFHLEPDNYKIDV
jgi:ectoine hydroxylase-related dioxygenase (phytanoyl-CoA dioxygenase family)